MLTKADRECDSKTALDTVGTNDPKSCLDKVLAKGSACDE